MKQLKFNRNLMIYGYVISISLFLFSCEQEGIQEDMAMQSDIEIAEKVYDDSNCATDCIDPDGPFIEMADSSVVMWGGKNNDKFSKEVTFSAYNTATSFVVEVLYSHSGGNSADLIEVTALGTTKQMEDIGSGMVSVFTFSLEETWEACDPVPFTIRQEGINSPIDMEAIYTLFEVCGCSEDFYHQDNQDGSYTFTYLSEDTLEDAEVSFTTPHILGYEALDGKEYTSNPGNGNGANTVVTWTGDIDSCEPITFTLLLIPDCEQNNSGKVNLFTDFKVNGESKKEDEGSITTECE